jgi:DNA-cytosine methyltransferase
MKTLGTQFTGGGGFEAGAGAAGYTPIWGIEYDAEIAGVYARNFGPHCIVSAVEDVDYSTLPTPDHHHASPSCKKASVANKERGETPEDIAAAEAVARAIRALQSPNFSLENVWGYREFESFRIILRALEETGYAFNFWHLNAADYGVPQTRKRLILLASKTHRPRRPEPTHVRKVSAQVDLFGSASLQKWEGWYRAVEDLIPTLPESRFAKWQLERLPQFVDESFYTIAQQSDDKKGTETGYGCPRRGVQQPALTVTNQTPSWFKAFIVDQQNAGRETTVKDCGSPMFTVPVYSVKHPAPRAFLVTEQYRESNATASEDRTPQTFEPEQPSPSIMADHKGKFRAWLSHGRVVSMSPRALARFQSFPDSYVLPEKAGLACRVIGNAVPSLLAQRIIESMAE